MFQTSLNNWYTWSYASGSIRKQSAEDNFITSMNAQNISVKTFAESLIYNAQATADYYFGKKFSVFFSGGVDSELIVRSYKEIGKDFTACIVRYENDINMYDVSYAVAISESLGIKYKIIDMNLQKFYENEAEKISDISQVDRPRALPQLKFLDFVDDIPIIGHSDPTWYRPNDDYKKPCEWLMCDWEHEIGGSRYALEINRPSIMEWFRWTPEIVVGFTKMKWFEKLIADGFYGKLGTNSTKIIGYKETYPDLLFRSKKTGFEKINDLINDFEKHLEKKNKGLIYRCKFDRTLEDIKNLEIKSS